MNNPLAQKEPEKFRELWNLMSDISEDCFSASWFMSLKPIIEQVISGKNWRDVVVSTGYDPDCVREPSTGDLAKMSLLIGMNDGQVPDYEDLQNNDDLFCEILSALATLRQYQLDACNYEEVKHTDILIYKAKEAQKKAKQNESKK